MKRWKALAGVAAVAALLLTPLVATSASAAQPQQEEAKVFVCKYVGTPGDGERLQTGDNPINPSVNSIKGNFEPGHVIKVGDVFTDSHGRSVVLAFDHGQAKPPFSACAATPDVLRNAAWSVDVQAPTCGVPGNVGFTGTNATITPGDSAPGTHAVTFTADPGHAFADGTLTHTESYTILPAIPFQSADRSAPCYTEAPVAAAASVVVTDPTCADRDGSVLLQYGGASVTHATINGDEFPVVGFYSGTYATPPAGAYVITVTAASGFSFDGSPTKELDFTVAPPLKAGDCAATAVFDVEPTPPACNVPGSLPAFVGDRDGYTLSLAPTFAGPGAYTLTATADAGLEFAGGKTVLTKDIVVKAALDPAGAACLVAEEPNPAPSGAQSLAATGGSDMTPLGIGAGMAMIAGLALLMIRRAPVKR